jgi:hypothetical protein
VDSFTPELKLILKRAGCHFIREGRGEHEIWFIQINGKPFVVDNKIKSRHTANAVLKLAGLPKGF